MTDQRHSIWFVFAVLAATLWHAWPFFEGYRVTADSVYFLDSYLRGPEEMLAGAQGLAQGMGRIGMHLLAPLNMLGAFLHEFTGWRVLFVGLYILLTLLCFLYASKLLSAPLTPVCFLLWLALHPLAFEHMPPVSYPLQNTVPFLVIVAVRLWNWDRHSRGIGLWVGRIAQGVAMLSTEYATILAVVLIGAEAFIRQPLFGFGPKGWLTWPKRALQDRAIRADFILLLIVIIVYFAYRSVYPSQYEGTQLTGLTSFSDLAYTTLRHVTDGLSIARFDLAFWQSLASAPSYVWFISIASGVLLALLAWSALGRLGKSTRVSVMWPGLYLSAAILVVTIPLSASSKLQAWCVDDGACGYLDSRSSMLAVILIAVLLIARAPLTFIPVRAAIAASFGALFVITSLHNWKVRDAMSDVSAVWESAEALACVADQAPEDHSQLRNLIDPARQVGLHPPQVESRFWVRYVARARGWSDCADDAVLTRLADRSYVPGLAPGEQHLIEPGMHSQRYLGRGWSQIEPQGVWTNSEEAELNVVPIDAAMGETVRILLSIHGFFDEALLSQRLVIAHAGEPVWSGELHRDAPLRDIAFEVIMEGDPKATLSLVLHTPDARPPLDGSDGRSLGVFLLGLSRLD